MVHAGIYATLLECTYKAGKGASAIATDQLYVDSFLAQAEAYINTLCRQVFATTAAAFALLDANKRHILTEAASNLCAIYIAQYDLSGYNTQREAENIINTNWARFQQCISLLQEQDSVTFVK